ncbi:MAG: HAD family hydrolase [Prevotella sp.]|jgi:putative hydrolase of the HAD superfamily|nr:HAD family hydrolase [Prevotella sp.]
MFDITKIKGIIFDYGGTIDSNGKHWAEVLWDAYQYHQAPVTKEQFREAYVQIERHLAVNYIIKPHHNFMDVLKIKTKLQLEYLADKKILPKNDILTDYSLSISNQCYTFASDIISKEKPILKSLHTSYPVVLVSNFYGNIQAALTDFGLREYFDEVIESAVVGIRKPNPAIFGLGVDKLGLAPENVVVIGDSYTKDIAPAATLGCRTIWLKGQGWGDDSPTATADRIITDFSELKTIFRI